MLGDGLLQGTCLLKQYLHGLGSTYIAGFDANGTADLLGLSIGEGPIGILPVGGKA